MTIHLPKDIESSIEAAVIAGISHRPTTGRPAGADYVKRTSRCWPASIGPRQGLIGALRDDAELLDQAVEHAMKVREERPWRLAPGE